MTVCFLGGARYSQPLDSTSAKKFRALAELGKIFVIGFSQDLRPRRFYEHAHFYLLPKWPWPVLRYLTMFAVGPWLALWVVVRYGVTVLVAQSPYEGLAAAWAKTLARRLGRRVALVVESHGDFEESLFLQRRVGLPSLYRFLMRWAARFALDRADVLRAVSNSTRAQLERWAQGKPIVQFTAWTDIEVFLKKGDEPGDRRPEILYAGVLTPLKGVHHLISAFARIAPEIPEAELVIIGRPENPDYAEELKAQVRREGLDGRVAFLGELPQEQLAERMRKGCVFVLPSVSEGLGRVVVEAMATGTPVIGSRVGGIPEMVQDGISGFLVPPGDEEALADRLRWVLTHPEEVRTMGERAREFARSFFSTEAYVEGYRRLLEIAEHSSVGTQSRDWVWDHLAMSNPIHAAVSAVNEEEERKKTMPYVEYLEAHLTDGMILDLGCGYGRIAKYLLTRHIYPGYIGIDRSAVMLKLFKERWAQVDEEKRTPLTLILGSIDHIPLRSCSVENVITAAVFLHNPKEVVEKAINEVYRVLKPGGKVFVFSSFPNVMTITGLQGVLYLTILKIMGKGDKQGPLRYYSKKEVISLFQNFSLVTIEENGFGFLPKSILGLPDFVNRLYRVAIYTPISWILKSILPSGVKKIFCAHYDVLAIK